MSNERMSVLRMLSEGKITVEEAEKLLEALEPDLEEAPESQNEREKDDHGRRGRWNWSWEKDAGRRPWEREGSQWPWEQEGFRWPWEKEGWPWEKEGFQWPWEQEGFRWPWEQGPSQGGSNVASAEIPENTTLIIHCGGGNATVHPIDGTSVQVKGHSGLPKVGLKVEGDRAHISSGGQSIEVEVPTGVTALQANIGGGSLRIRDLRMSVEARSAGGGVHIEGVVGNIQASAEGGSVELVDITSTEVEARARGGSVSMTTGTMKEGRVLLESLGGSTRLGLSEDSAFEVHARAKGGHIVCDFPPIKEPVETTELGKEHFDGTFNGGGAHIELLAEGGHVAIECMAGEEEEKES